MKNLTLKISKLVVAAVLVLCVILPLIRLLLYIDIGDVKTIIQTPQFGAIIFNSLFTTAAATAISIFIAWALAWAVNRSRIRYKSIFAVLFTLPMLIPSISHGMGLVLLFGDNGILTNWFGVNIGLYGYKGIIMGSVLYAFPVAFLMLTDTFKYEDYTVYEAAEVLGLGRKHQFLAITFPNMRKTLISVVFAVFTLIFTDYGVPLVVGGKIMTIPVYMYREVIGLLDFSKGAIIGVVLLLPAVIAFIVDLKSDVGGNASTVTKEYEVKSNKWRDRIAYLLCMAVILAVSIPLLAFAVLSVVKKYPIDMGVSLENITEAFRLGVGGYLMNSLTIAMLSSLIGMCVIYLTAYLTARSKKSFSMAALHLISMVSLAIPGIVLGLSYVLFFKGSVIYGTVIILVLVNMVHFFASPYLVAYNALSKFHENLEDIGDIMGIGRIRMLFDVFIPCTKETLVEMYSYIFINCMVTISAVSFLTNFRNMPLSLLIPQFDSQSLIEATAFISVVILAVNIVLKLIIFMIKRQLSKEENVAERAGIMGHDTESI